MCTIKTSIIFTKKIAEAVFSNATNLEVFDQSGNRMAISLRFLASIRSKGKKRCYTDSVGKRKLILTKKVKYRTYNFCSVAIFTLYTPIPCSVSEPPIFCLWIPLPDDDIDPIDVPSIQYTLVKKMVPNSQLSQNLFKTAHKEAINITFGVPDGKEQIRYQFCKTKKSDKLSKGKSKITCQALQ